MALGNKMFLGAFYLKRNFFGIPNGFSPKNIQIEFPFGMKSNLAFGCKTVSGNL